MDSSFLTGLHLVLSFCGILVFLKQMTVFGVSNVGQKIISHLATLSMASYFVLISLFDWEIINAWEWYRYRIIPQIIFATSLLIQLVMLVGGHHYQLHKTLTRIPLLFSLVILAWGGEWGDEITLLLFVVTVIFLFLIKNHRQQRRTLIKMFIFLFLSILIARFNLLIGEFILLPVVFYFAIFQNTFCIQNLLQEKKVEV